MWLEPAANILDSCEYQLVIFRRGEKRIFINPAVAFIDKKLIPFPKRIDKSPWVRMVMLDQNGVFRMCRDRQLESSLSPSLPLSTINSALPLFR